MRITFSEAGKRFNREWIFRKFDYEFLPQHKYAITGPNGSGKSTMLQVISGNMEASAGTVKWTHQDTAIDADHIFKYLAIAAPYLETIEELTATEFLEFHSQFKQLKEGFDIKEMLGIVGLQKAADKQIRYFSSGMKQRIKLAQAIFSNVPLLLLDEPCTNLDQAGIALYKQLIEEFCGEKTFIVSSNDPAEYSFCEHIISIADYK